MGIDAQTYPHSLCGEQLQCHAHEYRGVTDHSGRGMMARYAEKFQNYKIVGTNSPLDSASVPQNATASLADS